MSRFRLAVLRPSLTTDPGEGKNSADQPTEIRKFLVEQIPHHPRHIVAVAAQYFKVARTTIHRHLRWLEERREIIRIGATSGSQYFLKSDLNLRFMLRLHPGIQETQVWEDWLCGNLEILPENIFDILRYMFSSVFQNVLDHSGAEEAEISIQWNDDDLTLEISDNGAGLFRKIGDALGIADTRTAALELATTRVTTNPALFPGQGLFFASRAVDRFQVRSGNLLFVRNNLEEEWYLQTLPGQTAGTRVTAAIQFDSARRISDVFARYAILESETDPCFDRLHLKVERDLPVPGCAGRAHAKKLLQGADKFRHVVVDFENIMTITQGFVDEVFCVFPARNPNVRLEYVHANEDVQFMIQYARL